MGCPIFVTVTGVVVAGFGGVIGRDSVAVRVFVMVAGLEVTLVVVWGGRPVVSESGEFVAS